MTLLIGRNILFSFIALILLPLVIMAFFSGTIINHKMEINAANNLEANLRTIKLIYNESAKELESNITQKAYEISLKDKYTGILSRQSEINSLTSDINKSDKIDISLIIDKKDFSKYKEDNYLTEILKNSVKAPVNSTEIINNDLLKCLDKETAQKLFVYTKKNNTPVIAGLAQVAASRIPDSNKILVGIRFIKLNSDLWKKTAHLISGKVLFIQKNMIISEVDKLNSRQNNVIGIKISDYIYTHINKQKVFTSAINLSNKEYISMIEPLQNIKGTPVGAIFLAVSQDDFNDLKKQNATLISLTILTVGIIISTAAYIISQKLIDSLDQITEVTKAVRYGNLTKRVRIKAKDEIAQLGDNINEMIESLQDREIKIKEYQKEIKEQKENLEAIFNSLVDGIILISSDCTILKVNPTIAIWMGTREENIVGKKLAEILKCKCPINCMEDLQNVSGICPLICQNERLSPTEAKIHNMNTTIEKTLGLISSPVAGVIGEPTNVIVLRDITEFKEMNTMRDDFTATLTHDLRVPILAEANTLKFFLKGVFGSCTEKQKIAIENMLDSNNDLLRLVNSLLDTYRYESGKSELIKEDVHIRKLAQDCIAELTPLARKNNQSINNLIPKDIPILKIDKNEIKRVFRNLINNSIAYTPKDGLIDINADFDDEFVIIKVKDNGKGIAESELEMIFDRFFSKAKKFRKIGTGLGLYLSKQIIEKHGGKIWAESKLGEGSTFYFSLPREIEQ